MTILDQPDRWMSVDPQSMYSLVESFPEQVETAAKTARDLQIREPGNARVVVVTGLGGSAIGGDLVRSIAGSGLRLPLIVNRDYGLPGFVDSSTVVIACSYSGNTEETLSAYQQARVVGASILCITSGGQLESVTNADGYPMLRLPGGLPARGFGLFVDRAPGFAAENAYSPEYGSIDAGSDSASCETAGKVWESEF